MWAIVPVRTGTAAKSRLATRTADQRASLSLAFARDTLAAIARCEAITGTILVADPAALDELGAGCTTVEDPGAGLNAAIRTGASAVPRGSRCVAILADLPCLTPDVLAIALEAAQAHSRAFVCDAEGIGTTLLISDDPALLDPRFGERSRAAHADSGAYEITDDRLARLRRDVDSEVALWDAIRLGVGPATLTALA